MYTDTGQNAQENVIKERDLVLMKKRKIDNFWTNFNSNPMKIVSKRTKLVESPAGLQYQRNVTYIEKFIGDINSSISD